MANGANAVHMQLRQALENYIKSQYFGKSPILLSALQGKLDQEGVLYQKPYIESSPAYKSKENGIQDSEVLPDWLKTIYPAVHRRPGCLSCTLLPSDFCSGGILQWGRFVCVHWYRLR